MIFSFTAAWSGHTDASRALAADITAALDAAFTKREHAADAMGLHPADLSRQLSGRDPLNLWRLADLPLAFWLALLRARCRRIGAELLTPDQVALLKGAAAMGSRMLGAVLPSLKERKSA